MPTPRSILLGTVAALVAAVSVGLSGPIASAAVGNANLTAPGLYQCVVGSSGSQVLSYAVNGGMGGGYPNNAAQGGTGASLSGTMTLTGGQTLYITVGSNGVDGATWPIPDGGGVTRQTGSSGGGYSSISLSPNANPIVVAGGGGGGGASLAPGGSAVPGSSPQGKGGAGGGGGYQGNQGMTGGIQGTSGKGGSTGGGNGGTPGSSGANAVVGYGGGGGGAGFGQTIGGAGDWNTSNSNNYQFTNWNGSPVPFGGGGGGGLWSGGGGGGWAGGGGAGGTNEFPSAEGGGGGGGSSLLATNNAAGVTATQSSASSGSQAGSVSLSGVSCNANVTYMANGGAGTVPVDPAWYAAGALATVLSGNTLTGPGSTPYFVGWSTSQGQGSVQYAPGSTIAMSGPAVLWAQYTAGTTVSFNANGGTGTMLNQVGITPAALNSNLYTFAGYGFLGWNTVANGTGTSYANGATFPFSTTSQSVALYAQWAPVVTVTYNANGGSWYVDATTQAGYQPGPLEPVSGFEPPNGQVFTGWNTAADGSGTTYQTGQTYAFNADLNLYAQYAPAAVINFDANGGTGTMYNQVGYQPTPINPNTYVRSGYAFTGWNTATNGTGTSYANQGIFPFSGGIGTSLYAQWGTPTGTVTFNANGGSGTMAPQSSIGPAALAPNAFSPPSGQGFLGWNTDANGLGTSYASGAVYSFHQDLALYAQWGPASTVTFNANGGGGVMASQSASASTPLNANAFTPPLAGQAFLGWSTTSGVAATAYSNGDPYAFTASTTLYAQWGTPTGTVTFNANGGAGSMPPQSSNGSAPLTANAFTRTFYTFTGWNTAANGLGTSYVDGDVYPFTASLVLYAQWTAAEFTVTFNANGGGGAMASQADDTPTALNANSFTPPAGTVFTGWNTAANGTGVGYAPGAIYPFNANATLYAQWSGAMATVTFDANNGSGAMAPQSGNAPTPLEANTFTRTGYTFAGWNTNASGIGGTRYANGATYPFNASVTLYAQWTMVEKFVTFHANGGTGVMNPQVASAPTTLRANAFTRTGQTFTSWNTAANGTGVTYFNEATYQFDANTTLYAQWTVAPAAYTVTFNANGGVGSMAPQTASTPTALSTNAFTKVGQVFVAWNTAADGTGATYANGATYPFSASVTLYAQWVDVSSKVVTFNANGGSGSMTPQVSSRPANLNPNTFSRSGYTFASWNTAANGTGVTFVNQSLFPFASNATLYAQWTPAPSPTPGPTPTPTPTFTVSFNPNGGTGAMASQSASAPTTLTPNAFTRSGYTFVSWNTAADGSGTAYANRAVYPFTASVTLFAQWGDSPGVVMGLKAAQTGVGEVSASWTPLGGGAITYDVALYTGADIREGSCKTAGKACTIDSVPPGSYTLAVTATAEGITGRPALTAVTVIDASPSLKDSWRGSGRDAKRAYAAVIIPKAADPAEVLVWRLVQRDGRAQWVPQSVIRDIWTCRYARSDIACTWEQVVPTRARIKFSVNGMYTEVASFRSPRRA